MEAPEMAEDRVLTKLYRDQHRELWQEYNKQHAPLREKYVKELFDRHPEVRSIDDKIRMLRAAGWTVDEIHTQIRRSSDYVWRRLDALGLRVTPAPTEH